MRHSTDGFYCEVLLVPLSTVHLSCCGRKNLVPARMFVVGPTCRARGYALLLP